MIMKTIEGYEGLYSITTDGRVWSHEKIVNSKNKSKAKKLGKWLKPSLSDRYYKIRLYKNKVSSFKLIHRLVAQIYIPNPENKPQVNHLNGIKTDNRISNLSWCTAKENDIHAREIGLMDNSSPHGEKNGMAKLTQEQINEIRQNHIPANGIFKRKPWKKYKISTTQYYRIIRKENWKETKH